MKILRKLTQKMLKENKLRTIVTIVGVILSVAMFTAVTTFGSSLQQLMIDLTVFDYGSWHARLTDMPVEKQQELLDDSRVKGAVFAEVIGDTPPMSEQNDRGHMRVMGLTDNADEVLSLKLLEGRMPENDTEIIISYQARHEHPEYALGQTINLPLGTLTRLDIDSNGQVWNNSYEQYDERSYTVVGIMDNFGLSSYLRGDIYGFTCTTFESIAQSDNTLENFEFVTLHNPRDVFELKADYGEYWLAEGRMLLYMGITDSPMHFDFIFGIVLIIVLIIMIASVLLIHTAFSISIQQRTKLYGLLSSVGATKRQMIFTVLYEAFLISIIAIPVGLISGIGGIAVTLSILGKQVDFSLIPTKITVFPWAIIGAILLAVITILISTYPAIKKVSKMAPLDAIRQTEVIKITDKEVKNSFIVSKMGIGSRLAEKNFKRNKKQYRSIVISLTISVMLFLASSSFVNYFSIATEELGAVSNYDIEVYDIDNYGNDVIPELYAELVAQSEVTEIAHGTTYLPDLAEELPFTEEYLKIYREDEEYPRCAILVYENVYFKQFLKDHTLPESNVVSYTQFVGENNNGQQIQGKTLAEPLESVSIVTLDGNSVKIPIDQEVSEIPIGMTDYFGGIVVVMMSEDTAKTYLSNEDDYFQKALFLKSSDAKKTRAIIEEKLYRYRDVYMIDAHSLQTNNRNLIRVVNVFSTGFIVLLSLIAVANVFNAISTSIGLRKQEFAILQSVGMGEKALYRMIQQECLIYGAKALLYGLPLGLLCNLLLREVFRIEMNMPVTIPLFALICSIVGVFAVVFIGMVYATRKIYTNDIIETLKNENI